MSVFVSFLKSLGISSDLEPFCWTKMLSQKCQKHYELDCALVAQPCIGDSLRIIAPWCVLGRDCDSRDNLLTLRYLSFPVCKMARNNTHV